MLPAKPPLPIITEHALLRWLERVHGIDVDFYREKLRAEVAPYLTVGAKRFDRAGFTYELKNGALITVRPTKRGKMQRLRQ